MNNEIQPREQWGSKLGFVLAAAGSAVGLGNIWKFPYVTGQNGGGAFVVLYILLVFGVCAAVMLAEFAIGRSAASNAVGSFQKLKGGLWPLVGWFGVAAGFVILSYYGVVAGWTIAYIVKSFTGLMTVAAAGQAGDAFGAFIANSTEVVVYQAIFMALCIFIIMRGVAQGIEKWCKFLMPGLFVILLLLIVRAVTLDGAKAGLDFYLKPDFSKINGGTFFAALGQAFFSLSLGMGTMLTYGSYLSKKESLPSSTMQVCFLDTLVAILAGLAIFPAVFAFGIEPGAGPGLTFITLPNCFAQMPGGMIWSALFFVLLFIAALTSAISLLETVTACFKDRMGWSRGNATIIMGTIIFLLGVPSAISLGKPDFMAVAGMNFMDAMSFLSDKILLPVGGFFIALFVGWFWLDGAKKEVTNDGSLQFGMMTAWVWACRIVAPVAIAWIFIKGF